MKLFIIGHCWLFILVLDLTRSADQSSSNQSKKALKFKKPSVSLEKVVNVTPDQEKKWKHVMNLTALKLQIGIDKYRKNTYDPKEAERLLQIDVEVHAIVPNFWRSKTAGPQQGHFEIHPMCSQQPQDPQEGRMISAHEYFHSDIQIPVQQVPKIIRYIEYQHYSPTVQVWKDSMECNCDIVQKGDIGSQVCVGGKINLSKGVGGNGSFFVFVPIAPDLFKVVAHIYFDKEWPIV